MAIVFRFLAAHWGKALAGVLLVTITWYVVALIQDNKDLIASLAQREMVVALRQADVKFLEERLDNIRDDLERIEKQNLQIQNGVDLSTERINELEQQRIDLLNEIQQIELPDTAEEQINWLKQQALMRRPTDVSPETD